MSTYIYQASEIDIIMANILQEHYCLPHWDMLWDWREGGESRYPQLLSDKDGHPDTGYCEPIDQGFEGCMRGIALSRFLCFITLREISASVTRT